MPSEAERKGCGLMMLAAFFWVFIFALLAMGAIGLVRVLFPESR